MKVAVVGLGMASKPHLEALSQLKDHVELTGVYARDRARSVECAREYGVRAYDSAAEIAADSSIDAVIIITPPNARKELVEEFARAGKHILMEKPVERTLSAAEQIVEICEQADVTLGIVFQHRFRKGATALTQMVDSGALGELALARADIPWWRDQSYYDAPGRGTFAQDGGGVLITQAIHVLDLMLSLTGPVTEVQAIATTTHLHKMEAEDFAAAGLAFENGAAGSVVATTAGYPGGGESLTIDGNLGSARLKAGVLTVNWRDGRTDEIGEAAGTGGGADPMAFPCDWHRDLIQDFAAAIARGDQPRVTGREALKVHRLLDAIEQSARNGVKITVEHHS